MALYNSMATNESEAIVGLENEVNSLHSQSVNDHLALYTISVFAHKIKLQLSIPRQKFHSVHLNLNSVVNQNNVLNAYAINSKKFSADTLELLDLNNFAFNENIGYHIYCPVSEENLIENPGDIVIISRFLN